MAGRMEEYEAEQIIIKQGQKNDKIYVVLEGSVALYMNYKQDNEYVVGIRGKDKLFGEMSMLSGEESMYTAVAFTDVKVAWFQEGNLEQFLKDHAALTVEFLKKMAKNDAMLRKDLAMVVDELNDIKEFIDEKDRIKLDTAKVGSFNSEENVAGD